MSADPADLERQIRALLDQGQMIEAIKLYRQATGLGLAEAKRAIEGLEQGNKLSIPPRKSTGDFETTVLDLLHQGKKIEAIKLYREKTGLGLKESKDAVDELAARQGIQNAGCLGLVLVLVTLCSLAML